ncbi:MAG: hypothetical protein ACR2ID_05205 [Chthoniobacterales bacterium]
MTDDSADADFQSFIRRLRKAVEAHDANTIAAMMIADFAFRRRSSQIRRSNTMATAPGSGG